MVDVCPACGRAIVEKNSRYCAYCGCDVRQKPPPPPEEKKDTVRVLPTGEEAPTVYIPPKKEKTMIESDKPILELEKPKPIPNPPCGVCGTETEWSGFAQRLYCSKCEPELHRRQLHDMGY